MTGLTNYSADRLIDHLTGKTAIFALPTAYVALFTAVGDDSGAGFTEVTGGAYARVATAGSTWNAAAGQAPSSASNAQAIQFPAATADWGTVIAFGVYDAATSGNLLWWDYLGGFDWLPFTGLVGIPGILTSPAHGYSNGDKVVVTAEYGGTLPATAGSWAGLLSVAAATTDTFTAGVTTTGTGDGMVRKVSSQSVPSGVQVSFAGGTPGTLILKGA